MTDGNQNFINSGAGLLSQTGTEGRQDWREEKDGGIECRGENSARAEGSDCEGSKAEKCPVIYVIRCPERGGPIYVGMTSDCRGRLEQHRRRFGKLVNMEILQEEFVDETPEEPERKWINEFSARFPLLNLTKKLPPRKRLEIQEIEDNIELQLHTLEHLEKMRNAEIARLDRIAKLRRSYVAKLKDRVIR